MYDFIYEYSKCIYIYMIIWFYINIYIYIIFCQDMFFCFYGCRVSNVCLQYLQYVRTSRFILDWKNTYKIVRSMAQGSRIASLFWTISTALTCSPDYLLIIYIYGALNCSSWLHLNAYIVIIHTCIVNL
jgi:hypothetical protein